VSNQRLKITEIFYSLQGEACNVGLPTVFIRLTGCPLRCTYCDTEYAFTGGEWLEIPDIIDQVKNYNTRHITVTGGEPLAQKNCIRLLKDLCDLGYDVSLETSGALPVADVDERVIKVIDVKTPSSNESDRNRLENLAQLNPGDQLKFVISDEADYDWSKKFIRENQLGDSCEILFSPVHEKLQAEKLAEWILKDQLNVRFQIQLHKYLWGDRQGV
jgi:7-carboxy-7-deazaguanine synthase